MPIKTIFSATYSVAGSIAYIATDVARSVVCVSVCLLVTPVELCKNG